MIIDVKVLCAHFLIGCQFTYKANNDNKACRYPVAVCKQTTGEVLQYNAFVKYSIVTSTVIIHLIIVSFKKVVVSRLIICPTTDVTWLVSSLGLIWNHNKFRGKIRAYTYLDLPHWTQ